MSKKVIGIFPKVELPFTEDPFQDRYSVVNNYARRVYEANAIPVGLLLNNGEISTEELDLCDAFLLPGGNKIDPNVYKLLEYAREHDKPVLGVCMGMQEMMIYSVLYDDGANPFNKEEYKIAYDNMKTNDPVLHKLEDNTLHFHEPQYDLDGIRHLITVDENSLLSEIYNSTKLNVVSLHGVITQRTGSLLNIVAHSEDGVIEAVENKDMLWLGVQYHPEIDDNDILIKSFIERLERRK